MILGKIRQDVRRLGKFVVRLVPLLLLAVDRRQGEVQSRVLRIGPYDLAKRRFGFVKVLLAGFGSALEQGFRNGRADFGRLDVS